MKSFSEKQINIIIMYKVFTNTHRQGTWAPTSLTKSLRYKSNIAIFKNVNNVTYVRFTCLCYQTSENVWKKEEAFLYFMLLNSIFFHL